MTHRVYTSVYSAHFKYVIRLLIELIIIDAFQFNFIFYVF